MGYLEIIRIDFDNIWQKYSKMSGLKDDKLIKKSKLTWKLKHANSILESFDYFYQMSSKSVVTVSSHTVSKLVHFFLRHSVY